MILQFSGGNTKLIQTLFHVFFKLENPNVHHNYGVYANGMLSESCSQYAMKKMHEYNDNKRIESTNETSNKSNDIIV